MTIQTAIKTHIPNKQTRLRISNSFLRRGIDLMSVKDFAKKYNKESILQFHNIGQQTAKELIKAIKISL